MSKASRKRNKDRRDAEKRARRAANKLHWQSLAAAGQNTKSKRSLRFQKKRRTVKIHGKHAGVDFCGNPACTKCFPELHRAA